MGSGFSKRKKQAKALQEQLMQMQEKMKETVVTGSAGNGLVEITVNGEGDVQKITIKPDCVDPEDVEGLEDLVKEAFNKANAEAKKNSMGGMGDLGALGGMGGLPGMPF